MNKGKIITGGGIFVVSFGVYLFTLCPTIYWEDSAAFSAAHYLLGIPHSPGFPIYVLLGKLFLLLPAGSPAFLSNLMSAFWGSLSLALLYLSMFRLKQLPKHGSLPSRDSCWTVSMVVGMAFLAFSSAFWLQTIRAEVYTLNLFFTLLLVFLSIKWSEIDQSFSSHKLLLLFSFVFGLSLTNHPLLIITLAPAFLLFFLIHGFKRFLSPTRLIIGATFLLLGISVYLYLPIRSSLSPAINWGRPDTFSGLFSYLLRTGQPQAASTEAGFSYLSRVGFDLSFPVSQFGLAFFWVGVIGAFSLYNANRKAFILTISIFILNILTAAWATDFSLRNYDLLGYLLPSLSMFSIWFAWGVNSVLSWLTGVLISGRNNAADRNYRTTASWISYLLIGMILLSPLYQIRRNFYDCNKGSQIWAYRYASQILDSVKKDAIILVGDDNTLTPLWYLNLSQGKRPDVKILSISAVTQANYREQVGKQCQGIMLPQNGINDLGKLALEISQLNANHYPIYSTYYSTNPDFIQHLRPAGFIFELCPKPVILTDNDIEEQEKFLRENLPKDNVDLIGREQFGNLVFNLGGFYDRLSLAPKSMECFLQALEIDPSSSRIYFQLGKAFLKNGDKQKAFEFLQAGLELDPYNQEARKLLEQG